MQKCHCCQVIFDPFRTKPQRGNRISKIRLFSTQGSTLEAGWSTLPTKNCFYGVVLVLKILKTSFHSFKSYSRFYEGQTDKQTDRKTDRQTHAPHPSVNQRGEKNFMPVFYTPFVKDNNSGQITSFFLYLPPSTSLSGRWRRCLHTSSPIRER